MVESRTTRRRAELHRDRIYALVGYGWADVVPSRGLYETFLEEKTVDTERTTRACPGRYSTTPRT